jgi:hypothetical protein
VEEVVFAREHRRGSAQHATQRRGRRRRRWSLLMNTEGDPLSTHSTHNTAPFKLRTDASLARRRMRKRLSLLV